MEYPKVSILIPTLNSERVIGNCLSSISIQDYPKDSIEIIIADGGSTDKTVEISKKYNIRVVENRLKTAEAGKMCALRNASGEYAILVDSDNILPDRTWIKRMIEPLLRHTEALGSEPLYYVWRKEDGFISRYCALIGMNDPLVLFLGNYDRMSLITNKWTEIPHNEEDHGDYLLVSFSGNILPTIGANGTVFRSEFLRKFTGGDYLFDIDILFDELKSSGKVTFIKIKNGIVHTFCEGDIGKFIRKQERRVRDYLFFKNSKNTRSYDWENMGFSRRRLLGLFKFIIYCLTLIPLLIQMIIGFSRKRDPAWLFHPAACWITLVIYGWYSVFGRLYRKEYGRRNWKQ